MIIRGQSWQIHYTHRLPSGVDGQCDYESKTILIRKGLQGYNRMWTLAHEILHAAYPDICEDAIDGAALSVTRALWAAGYRRSRDGKKKTDRGD